MKLKKAQKEAVLIWIAEGLESDEINKRAAKFKPRFSVSRSQVDWYRKTRGVKLTEIRDAGEENALTTGFALKENRVQALQSLAKKMLEELTRDQDNRLWTTNAKGIGSGDDFERYDYEEFNKAELDSLRGVLDDIASEIGERVRKTDLTSGGKPLPRPGIDPKQLKNLSNDELIALETAAEILERSGADQDPAIKS
jgi:hypothetical protein